MCVTCINATKLKLSFELWNYQCLLFNPDHVLLLSRHYFKIQWSYLSWRQGPQVKSGMKNAAKGSAVLIVLELSLGLMACLKAYLCLH